MTLTESVCLQISQNMFPLVLLMGDACSGILNSSLTELRFASVMPQLHKAAAKLTTLTDLIVNLVQQLGALCSEQTRKSTVISGVLNKPPGPSASTVAQLIMILMDSVLAPSNDLSILPRIACAKLLPPYVSNAET